ncbi:hypothetical protein SKAU_G00368490 [Synaphobranchus kaupii]|uniref:Uncharacterized protein n=1 Tax=Synaphobranchus kaupii TaxID=118154 RepID=A0A9Q1EFK4_SYNKA|nr:hypothetical protein SKAU_G00368490 [Synaphobranchus kaupii]
MCVCQDAPFPVGLDIIPLASLALSPDGRADVRVFVSEKTVSRLTALRPPNQLCRKRPGEVEWGLGPCAVIMAEGRANHRRASVLHSPFCATEALGYLTRWADAVVGGAGCGNAARIGRSLCSIPMIIDSNEATQASFSTDTATRSPAPGLTDASNRQPAAF